MSQSGGELWEQRFLPDEFDIDVLLPTGILCSMKAQRDLTLKILKDEAWKHAMKLPLYELLGDRRVYIFTGVTQEGRKEEFIDEFCHVSQLKLFMPVLRLLQPEGDKAEQAFTHALRDIGVPIHELDAADDDNPEAIEYRRFLLSESRRLHAERKAKGLVGLALYEFPPEVDLTKDLPEHLRAMLPDGKIDLIIRVTSINDQQRHMYHFVEPESTEPQQIINRIVRQFRDRLLLPGEELTPDRERDLCERYALKVCGRLTFLMGEHKISQFKYIRQCIKLRKQPTLIVEDLLNWLPNLENDIFPQPTFMRIPPAMPPSSSSAGNSLSRKSSINNLNSSSAASDAAMSISQQHNHSAGEPQSMWRLGAQNYAVHLVFANNVPVGNNNFEYVYVIVGLYHGVEQLCAPRYSQKQARPIFKERLTFDIDYNNIPPCAKICVSVCGIAKRSRRATRGAAAAAAAATASNRAISDGDSITVDAESTSSVHTADPGSGGSTLSSSGRRDKSAASSRERWNSTSTTTNTNPPPRNGVLTLGEDFNLDDLPALQHASGSVSSIRSNSTTMAFDGLSSRRRRNKGSINSNDASFAMFSPGDSGVGSSTVQGGNHSDEDRSSDTISLASNASTITRFSSVTDTHTLPPSAASSASAMRHNTVTGGRSSAHGHREFHHSNSVNTPTSSSSAAHQRQTHRKRSEMDESQHMCIAWGNFNLFNHQRELIRDRQALRLWPATRQALISQAPGPDMLHPLGAVGSNRDSTATIVVLEFQNFVRPVKLPTPAEFMKWGTKLTTKSKSKSASGMNAAAAVAASTTAAPVRPVSDAEIKQLDAIIKRDSLYELSEQEKSFLYSVRQFCVDYRPDALPKLLESIRWNSRDEVAQLYVLLEEWRQKNVLPLVKALTLLDFKYPDQNVRMYAAQCLDMLLNDTLLEEYLLQFVQVLKHEQYLNNDVTVFLLRRATRNRRLTHYLFWHIKTEIDADPSVRFRFGVLLEALCRACPSHVEDLRRQVSAVNILKLLSDELRVKHEDGRPKWFVEQLDRGDYKKALSDLNSPLDPDDKLGVLQMERCFVLSSAKRPLWLVWTNPDQLARLWFPEHELIFKNGDDLRQDMLTLQSLRLMDSIWQAADLDLRVLPYNCISLGINAGMIEVVRNSKTIMQIQHAAGGTKGKYQMDYTAIHRWLKGHNPSDEQYRLAIQNFTYSCAGYCVATYILGIGDRHPDNIMLTEDGRIFHIDFGHFLGHFKKKFGISRERVPFVLIKDFVCVIAQGDVRQLASCQFFKAFAELCSEAYRILWAKGDLFIALFSMMLSTGIPELQSTEDLAYLRTTLGVDRTEGEAVRHFQEKFREAHEKAWTTKLDWLFHGIKH